MAGFSPRCWARLLACSALAAGLCAPLAARAQDEAARNEGAPELTQTGVLTFAPGDFTQYQPANALDMINRIPGFSFSAGDQVRGFQGAVGNVLIDGQRPSSKSVTLDALLARIPVDAVQRIELIRGGAPGIDMQGLPVVVNLVRKPGAGLTGAVEFGGKAYAHYTPGPIGKLQLTRKSGGLTIDGAINIEMIQPDSDIRQSGVGRGSLTRRDILGRYTAFGQQAVEIDSNLYQANLSVEYRRPKDLFHLNLGVERNTQPRSEITDLVTAAGAPLLERLIQDSTADKAEAGGDYERQLGHGATWQVVGLHTYKLNDLISSFATPASSTTTTRRGVSGESIARTSVQGINWRGVAVSAGAEAAFNTLDSTSGLIVGGASQALPSANVRVEEKRAEGFLTLSGRPTGKTSLELGVRVETSTISQSGDVNRSRSFTFAKPRVIFTWSPNKASQLRLRVERLVGQLNFEDFAASGDLTLGAAAAGNADLQPERAWVFEGAIERRFWGQGALVLNYTHREIEQVNDRVAIYTPAGIFDAPGNIARGTRDEAKLTLVLPLDRLGLKNLQLRPNYSYRESKVLDPVTGRTRQISGIQGILFDTTIIYDVPKWRSTFSMQGRFGFDNRSYRLVETRAERRIISLEANWSWKFRPDWLLQLRVDNIVPKLLIRDRDTYLPTRASPLFQHEVRRMIGDPIVTARLRKTF